MVSRTHFARHLLQRGAVKDIQQAFDKYLAKGKPAFVSHRWAALEDAVRWIRASGGTAVLAHPGRVAWSVYDDRDSANPGNLAYAMTASERGSTYVLFGTANDAEFETLATAMGIGE